ncbi:hypothetical protein [Acinetobacter pragensis]|uniref:Uncharacterized protein n=1 Tax=Acinetobacter pragensis TaxID=1806892 RepID=A0A151XY61_9GAMM|nr:hypothetical protein [Acinetobacter pragensis]KYQ70677.1 hypothetical protein AZH43_17620 [Acinetobacter pragensis]
MIQDKQTAIFLEQLKLLYPAAFKHNYIFYGMMKTKGMLDELKELVPWILAAMIFLSISMSLGSYIASAWPQISEFRAHGLGVLAVMLFFMLVTPFIIKQMKHSSISLYKQLCNTPIKLAGIILLQAVNIAYIESAFLQSVLFFFAISFGFVRFYKENLFREHSDNLQFHYLQEIRRICFWSYKQILKTKCQLFFSRRRSEKSYLLKQNLKQLKALHDKTMRFENQLCKSFKHINLETYLDDLMK